MNLVDASLLATVIFFAIYGVTSSIECGVALSFLGGRQKLTRRYFTPLWEVTNVFLVFGFTALAMLFSNSLHILSSALLSTLLIGLAALIIRAMTVLTIFYWRPDSLPRSLAWLFGLCCYLIPLTFAATGIYLYSGQYFWQSYVGWSMIFSAFLGTTAIGLLTMNNERGQRALISNELVFAAWLLLLGSGVTLASVAQLNVQKTPLLILCFLTIVGLLLTLLTLAGWKFKVWKIAVPIAFLSIILLALANRPYLIANQLRLEDAFSGAAYARAFVVGTVIILPLLLLGFWLFWKLLRAPER